MVFELVGSRILAPYLGTSTFVWASLIGIVLGSMSAGYWLGGMLSDRRPRARVLFVVISVTAALFVLINLLKEDVLIFLMRQVINLKLNAVISSLLLFSVPSLLLGMVSPYAVKLKIQNIKSAGRTVGNLYALSTLGSIAGTFLAGFVLIPLLGNTKIIYLLALVLLATALLLLPQMKQKMQYTALVVLILAGTGYAFSSFEHNPKHFDTQYNRVFVYEYKHNPTGKKIRVLQLNNHINSGMFLSDDSLVYEYTKYYELGQHFNPGFEQSLMLGGGAYSYPKRYLKKHPQAEIDVVEIDSELTAIAKKYFRLEDSPRLQIFHEDARTFINRSEKKYDNIYFDLVKSPYSAPYQLSTIETARRIHQLLKPEGVVIMNLISSIEGKSSRFLKSQYATYQQVFPQVFLFPVIDPSDKELVQNIMLIALKKEEEPSFSSPDSLLNALLNHRYQGELSGTAQIFSDDYAPVASSLLKD